MEQELKIKKSKIWLSCLFLAYIIATEIIALSQVFVVNLTNAQMPLLSVNPITSSRSRFRWTGYLFKNFFMYHPYITLFLFGCIFLFLLWLLLYFIRLLIKGYVARMEAGGVRLANDRVIPWHAIEAIEAKKGAAFGEQDKIVITLKKALTKNMIMRLFKKMSNEKIVLTQFKMPLQEAYRLLNEHWHKYS